jgi:hypothetical protein
MTRRDKTIVCKDCGKSFVFRGEEQDFFAEKGTTNRRDAGIVETRGKTAAARPVAPVAKRQEKDRAADFPNVKCILQLALHAGNKRRFLSFRERANLYIAITAL